MRNMYIWSYFFCITYFLHIKCEESSDIGGTQCVNYEGHPKMCYPPFQNHASGGIKVIATNTCGMFKRQKYCVGLSSAEMRNRCAHCNDSNPEERHPAEYLTDHNINNWWQSETLADNKSIHYEQSINLTINLGKQFHVTFIHLQFKSPRPRAMVIYRKYNDDHPWTPWLYLASNCRTYFNMSDSKGQVIRNYDDVLCTEEFSSLNEFYNGVVMFATIFGRPGSEDFFNNKKIMDWATASQIRIELKKMHTFGDQNAEEELLLTYFYAIKSIQVAARCWCNGHGNECRRSTGEGIEPKLFCVCHPSHHTTGQSCDQCDKFYQDQPWQMATAANPNACKICNCNGNSDSCIFNEDLYIKSGNISGGLCLNCLSNTKGPHCSDCLEGFYKDPSRPNRCIPCNCDQIGRETVQCDQTGKCICQPGIDGDKCTRCKGDHYNFGPFGCQPCNCNSAGINGTALLQCNPSTGTCYCKKNVIGEKCDSCVQGYFSLSSQDPLGCRPCFCFAHTKDCTNATGFVLKSIESNFQSNEDEWRYGVGFEKPAFTPMLDVSMKPPAVTWFQNRDTWQDNYFLWAPAKFIGNQRLSYNLHLELSLSFSFRPGYKSLDRRLVSMVNDLELISDTMSVSVPFDTRGNPSPEVDREPQLFRYILNEESGEWRERTDHFRFISILSNLVAIRVRLTNPYGFIRVHKAVLFTAVDKRSQAISSSNWPSTTNVEKCSCPPQFTGLSCENCARGFHRSSAIGTEFVTCIKCSCHNQSDSCDVRTGQCDCKYNSAGHNCERCNIGYYGDPTTLIRGVCKPCGCPGGTACELVKMADSNRVVCTDCPDNLGGYRCNRCRDNFFGQPTLNVSCQQCNCHGNIDYLTSCDHQTGKCSNCLYNSAGDHCETCLPGYQLMPEEYGPNRCKVCICHPHGSVDGGQNCDVTTGQCRCHPFVTGRNCDLCKPGFFNLIPSQACEPCKCFIPGSKNHTCDLVSGQCFCKPGVTGINCDRCEEGHFNLSQTGCQRCMCDLFGSTSQNCNVTSGECSCKRNIVGAKCDSCIENHHNITGGCPACAPCYTLLQSKVKAIKMEINGIVNNINSVNRSDLRVQNFSAIMAAAEGLNVTVNVLFTNVLKDHERITSVKSGITKSNNSLRDLFKELITLKADPNNERLKSIIEEIRFLKIQIEREINVTFKDKLKGLKKYIDDKSMTDSNITKMAEEARLYSSKVDQDKEKILKAISQTDNDLKNSINFFLELVSSYYKFVNETNEFDISTMGTLSDKVTTDGLLNLKDISTIDRRYSDLDSSLGIVSDRLKVINVDIGKLFNELAEIKRNAKVFEVALRQLITASPDLDSLEREIMTKSSQNVAKTRKMTELQELQKRMENAQKSINDTVTRGQKILKELQEISKNFDDVVNVSKIEAEINLKKLPKLKQDLQNIEQEILKLRLSSSDIIEKMKIAYNNSQELYLQSQSLETKYKDLLAKVLGLKRQTTKDLEFSSTIKRTMEDRLKNDTSTKSELQNMNNILKDKKSINKNQLDSTYEMEKVLKNLETQLKLLEDQSKTMSDEKIEIYSKMIDTMSADVDEYERTQIASLTTEIDTLNEDWLAINREIDDTDVEIKRLEQINSHMIGQPTCHKSGGNVER